jgi:hypothetical protein
VAEQRGAPADGLAAVRRSSLQPCQRPRSRSPSPKSPSPSYLRSQRPSPFFSLRRWTLYRRAERLRARRANNTTNTPHEMATQVLRSTILSALTIKLLLATLPQTSPVPIMALEPGMAATAMPVNTRMPGHTIHMNAVRQSGFRRLLEYSPTATTTTTWLYPNHTILFQLWFCPLGTHLCCARRDNDNLETTEEDDAD